MPINLLNDADIALTLSMSRSWVRGQRSDRKHGLPHTLKIDPVMIGSSPRYLVSDVEGFIEGLVPANKNGGGNNA
jgi:hypothetical protein